MSFVSIISSENQIKNSTLFNPPKNTSNGLKKWGTLLFLKEECLKRQRIQKVAFREKNADFLHFVPLATPLCTMQNYFSFEKRQVFKC